VAAGNREVVRDSSMTWTAPMGAADLHEAPGMVGLARAATPARKWGRAVG
jgi:hypothetical protein